MQFSLFGVHRTRKTVFFQYVKLPLQNDLDIRRIFKVYN